MFMTPIKLHQVGTVVKDAGDFWNRFYEESLKQAVQCFEHDGYHSHILILVQRGGDGMCMSFDAFVDQISKQAKVDERQAKEIAFQLLGDVIGKLDVVGYLDVGEAWMMADMAKDRSQEEVAQKYSELVNDHGGTLEKVPGRLEILYVRGLYGDEARTRHWKIGRRGKDVWLHSSHDEAEKPIEESGHYNASHLDQAILFNFKKGAN